MKTKVQKFRARSGLRAQNRRAEKTGLEISGPDPGSENRVFKMAGPGGPALCRSLYYQPLKYWGTIFKTTKIIR